ncbi:radical SAM family heme chaperone HemW [Geobacter sp. DSM 9736]|uniref:radical SAM family heme chaperone HemW n=1 Tax=Geobacter sp. DSM 9736 TaxID=1277350 RepID=UPI000B613C11|nr:radical SAM family heme chaperone HemW [Geobacter sp. DSM 9736]SNB47203.1 coproporphyrinogen III oxidase, anaerobic [Geobacter sp. DSM 9736]
MLNMDLALYVHFPFCRQKCFYCDFNSVPGLPVSPEDYAEALLRELELRSSVLSERAAATTLYFGGGTPSLMPPAVVESLVDAAVRLFGLSSEAEITIEANPGTVTPETLAGYSAAGVTRLSLGIQSFNDHLLSAIGRIHTGQEAVDAFRSARKAGFDNIAIDLIHGLPGQTLPLLRQDLESAARLAAEHVAVYALSVEEGTPFHRMAAVGDIVLPDENTAVRMLEEVQTFLEVAGYEHYEISNYSLPVRRSRHNQVYWRRKSYLGFGAGAHSFMELPGFGCRWRNSDNLETYLATPVDDLLAGVDHAVLTKREAMGEWFFLGLRMLEGVDLDRFETLFGDTVESVYGAELARLRQAGLVQQQDKSLKLSRRGLLFYNQVAANFL